ncbi:beta-lactamase/transpeptidase-like protein [Marasmius fiardii PR-910]|nr:beta-lactamase/transpeptidase-like protein [Marasmius fiardii PR-910]
MISLNSYDSPASARYAAVWVERSGSEFQAIHGVNVSTFQAFFDQAAAQGYVSTIVTATGPADSAIYSGVMEKISMPGWYQYCGLDDAGFTSQDQSARANRLILKSFDEYGTPNDRRYCGIWHSNPTYDKWSLWTDMSVAGYQTVFNSETTKPYWAPSHISVSEDQIYAVKFSDVSLGTFWAARHDMTAAQLQTEVDNQIAGGRYIVQLAGGGSGSNARYAALFASQDVPSARTWRVTGNAVTGFKDNSAASTTTEQIVQTFMQAAGVRQVQLSIAKNGVPLLDKAYTWSEPERPTTQIGDPFLLASCSKAFLEAVVQSLYNNDKLSPSTKVYPYLGYSDNGSGDPRRFTITVQQLLDHEGGYNRDISGDPTYNMRNIALAQSGGSRPATVKDVIDYVFPQSLDNDPGVYEYSNYGYLLLSYVVEVATGMPYFDYLKSTVLQPEGLNVKPWLTDPATHTGDNVIQESQYTGLTAREPSSPNIVADVFGGDGMYKDSALGPAALAANAQSLTKFIKNHATWGNGGRSPGAARSGSTLGARSWIESRFDGIDWSMTANTRDFPNGESDFDDGVVAAISNWLNTSPTA